MGPSKKNWGKIEGFQNKGGRWTWQTVILCFSCCVILTTSNLPKASADLSNETATLLNIKQAWGNPRILSSWSTQFNICSQWDYVTCDSQNTTVISLSLSGATVQSPLPESIGALANLQQLFVEQWGLVGEIPSSIGLLRNLSDLTLNENALSGSIPPSIGNLTKLLTLRLGNNNLSTLPQELSNLKSLESLSLGFNHFSGPIPDWIGSFPALQNLYLENNFFTGSFPASLANLTSLQQLQIYSAWDSTVSPGPLPSELGKMTSLQILLMDQNAFGGSIPESFGNLSSLIDLGLSECNLGGALPSSLGSLSNLQQIDFHSNAISGAIPPEFGNLQSLQLLYMYSNSLSGPIPEELGNLHSLVGLELEINFLNGSIPTQLSQLLNLTILDLSSNYLNGSIPPQLVTLPNLQTLFLEDNCLSGSIPSYNKSGPLASANFGQTGNSNCFNASQACKCGGAPSPALGSGRTAGGHSGLSKAEYVYLAVGVVLGSVVLLVVLLGFCFFRHKHQRKLVVPSSTYRGPVREYTVAQIKEATQNFSTKVGEGGFATVYKAVFANGTVAAVKRFNKKKPVESFEKEVELLSSLNHRFLVNLVGYCEDLDQGEHILLYEFMERGNLNESLHGCKDFPRLPLSWEERVRVLISVGHGIDYLHYGTDPPMIHRDIKSANILLSSCGKGLIAKLADFGMGRQTIVDADVITATFGNEPPKAFSTRIAGTPGYFDPEYVNTSVLSAKTDVYSYGVVLLELITGKPPLLEERFTLTEWAKPFLEQEDVWAILDPRLDRESCNEGQLRAVVALAYRCTQTDARDRPTMKEVLSFLTEVFSLETRMVNPSLRTSSSTVAFSGATSSDSYSSSRSRRLTVAEIEMMNNSTAYSNSEILPRD
ncbi:unnamed protein product [Calypogeia fissa]